MNPGTEHVDEPAAPPLRSDAERNRARIIAAARRLLGRGGLNISIYLGEENFDARFEYGLALILSGGAPVLDP
jgi:hypothetical protein